MYIRYGSYRSALNEAGVLIQRDQDGTPRRRRWAMGSHLRRIAALPGRRFRASRAGTVSIINRYRNTNQNLRTQLQRICKRAGVTPWGKPFHNLRASRETELAASFPLHVVCAWIGNSAAIAQKHYLQVVDADYDKAAGSAAKSGAVSVGQQRTGIDAIHYS
ncbi:MAG: hypothetical protein ACYC3I_01390 [Gemmataceae bacterium]